MIKKLIFTAFLLIIPCLIFYSCGNGDKKGTPAQDTTKAVSGEKGTDSINTVSSAEIPVTEKNELNKFFTYFSETGLQSFAAGALNDTEIIRFAVYYNYRNNDNVFIISKDALKAKVAAGIIDSTAVRFFGVPVTKHQPVDGIAFKKGFYEIDQAGGGEYTFSQVVKFYDNGNGAFTAELNLFTASSGWTGDISGSPEDWKKDDKDDMPDLTGKVKATVKKVEERGQSRYILIEYNKVK